MSIGSKNFRIRIYKISICDNIPNANKVWYKHKVGKEYFSFLAIKTNTENKIVPCFRVCDYDEKNKRILQYNMILDVSPEFCSVIEEYDAISESHPSIFNFDKKMKDEY